MTLYEINAQIRAFLEENVDPETGEVLNLDALGDLELERSAKLESYALAVKNYDAEIAAVKAEEDNLKARRERIKATRDKLYQTLLEELRGEKMSTARVQITYRKTQSTEVIDISAVPDKFLIPQPSKPDKTAIKAAIKAGENVSGAELRDNISMIIK
ncbi:MAG: siphovirus Gp157 family protein [Oscillospiraceae bacterium]|nr:siphovirus Gp157 family protein [Oscillospiraceae bacterium]